MSSHLPCNYTSPGADHLSMPASPSTRLPSFYSPACFFVEKKITGSSGGSKLPFCRILKGQRGIS
jgi:hypothetical protein